MIHTLSSGQQIRVVDREQLRRTGERRFFKRPASFTYATPPSTVNYQTGINGKTVYPMLGNNQYGDCYLVAILKYVMTWMAQYGPVPSWEVQKVIQRYLQLSGGDNGLNDDVVFREFKQGILGPNGPNKIVQDLLIDPNDRVAMTMALWRFTGTLFTFSVYENMMANANPGSIWDSSVCRGGIVGGHAVLLTGYNPDYDLQTWALDPCITLKPSCIQHCDPEAIVCFTPLNYHPVTRLSKAGFTWEEDRELWQSWNGVDPGPAPWPTPAPSPSPFPEPPNPNPVYGTVLIPATIIPSVSLNINGQTLTVPAYTIPERIVPVYKQDQQ